MSKNLHISVWISSVLVLISSGFWYYGNIDHNPIMVVKNSITPISNTANPFATGSSNTGNSILINTSITSPVYTGTKQVEVNLNWSGRTLSGVYYQFGSGNPVETEKSIEELIKMNMDCRNLTDPKCQIDQLSPGELVSGNDNFGSWNPTSIPNRITPEIEYLVYSLLSNPIIQQSSESCAGYFWTNDSLARIIYPQEDIGDVELGHWWNPYRININDFIIVNPTTGRKDLDLPRIWTLYTQLQIPSVKDGGQNYTNIPLRVCLQKNNQLQLLQSHVASHYERLHQAWHGN